MNNTPLTNNAQGGLPASAVDFRSVRYETSGRVLLDSISLHIPAGQYVALMGRNGSGKTTLIRLLGGLLHPTSGEVRVGGILTDAPESLAELHRRVGLVFQDPDDQMVAVTVEDEIAFGLENRAIPLERMEGRVEEALELFHLTSLRKRATSTLSGGEQQRVAIAAVWVTKPGVLVLDEPTSMLDLSAATELLALLDSVRASASVVHVTQSLRETERAERLLVLDEGHLVYDGAPQDALGDARTLRIWGIASREPHGPAVPAAESDGADQGIATENLTFSRDDGMERKPILTNVTFRAPKGSAVAVVGRSGSGKTTLACHLNRLLEPESGRVLIGVASAKDLPLHEVRRIVGMAFQRVDLQLFEASVAEDVAFGPMQRGAEREDALRLAREALKRVGLDPALFGNRAPATLSTGEQRRVALAGVLVSEPEIVVLDEPTSGLDAVGVDALAEILQELVDQGRTLVIVTHDLDFASRVAHSVLVLDDGMGTQVPDMQILHTLAERWVAQAATAP